MQNVMYEGRFRRRELIAGTIQYNTIYVFVSPLLYLTSAAVEIYHFFSLWCSSFHPHPLSFLQNTILPRLSHFITFYSFLNDFPHYSTNHSIFRITTCRRNHRCSDTEECCTDSGGDKNRERAQVERHYNRFSGRGCCYQFFHIVGRGASKSSNYTSHYSLPLHGILGTFKNRMSSICQRLIQIQKILRVFLDLLLYIYV